MWKTKHACRQALSLLAMPSAMEKERQLAVEPSMPTTRSLTKADPQPDWPGPSQTAYQLRIARASPLAISMPPPFRVTTTVVCPLAGQPVPPVLPVDA